MKSRPLQFVTLLCVAQLAFAYQAPRNIINSANCRQKVAQWELNVSIAGNYIESSFEIENQIGRLASPRDGKISEISFCVTRDGQCRAC